MRVLDINFISNVTSGEVETVGRVRLVNPNLDRVTNAIEANIRASTEGESTVNIDREAV